MNICYFPEFLVCVVFVSFVKLVICCKEVFVFVPNF